MEILDIFLKYIFLIKKSLYEENTIIYDNEILLKWTKSFFLNFLMTNHLNLNVCVD